MPKVMNEVQLARVTTDNRDRLIWIAATPRPHALDHEHPRRMKRKAYRDKDNATRERFTELKRW